MVVLGGSDDFQEDESEGNNENPGATRRLRGLHFRWQDLILCLDPLAYLRSNRVPLPSPRGRRFRRLRAPDATSETSELSIGPPGSKPRQAAFEQRLVRRRAFSGLSEDDHRHRFDRPLQKRRTKIHTWGLRVKSLVLLGVRETGLRYILLYDNKLQDQQWSDFGDGNRTVNRLISAAKRQLDEHLCSSVFGKREQRGIHAPRPAHERFVAQTTRMDRWNTSSKAFVRVPATSCGEICRPRSSAREATGLS